MMINMTSRAQGPGWVPPTRWTATSHYFVVRVTPWSVWFQRASKGTTPMPTGRVYRLTWHKLECLAYQADAEIRGRYRDVLACANSRRERFGTVLRNKFDRMETQIMTGEATIESCEGLPERVPGQSTISQIFPNETQSHD